ncbi:hypothetical protein VTL71DRAFT_13767 [Oculimacula yallundae]|uniref:Uncharacterized protein n=1 Tax=Oculimacula yallundae TaxID=86028 RepID=A0ABR4CNF5_9HELO
MLSQEQYSHGHRLIIGATGGRFQYIKNGSTASKNDYVPSPSRISYIASMHIPHFKNPLSKPPHLTTIPTPTWTIPIITTIPEFHQTIQDPHHHRVTIFFTTSHCQDLDADEMAWCHDYQTLTDVYLFKASYELWPDLQELVTPKVRPAWVTFYKGKETGWVGGGLRRFVEMHRVKK